MDNERGVIVLEKLEDEVTPVQITEEYKWAVDTFPALHKYKENHNADNLKKLCIQVVEFCNAIFASTQNEAERAIYNSMVKKINKQ